MKQIKIDASRAIGDILSEDQLIGDAAAAASLIYKKTGKGNDFLGWVNLPSSITSEELSAVASAAKRLRDMADVIVTIGIGGSYLGAKAVIEAMNDSFVHLRRDNAPVVVFAGQNISEDYTYELLDALKEKNFALIVISKSGTTTEPAIAFRLLRAEIEKRYGKDKASQRIVAVTDANRGALRSLSDKQGYETFVIPDDIGGRFSVFTPVGLLPVAAAGIDIIDLVRGARDMERITGPDIPASENPAVIYAAVRNYLYRKGYKIEILASYEPKLQYIAEWWKQLYGESEGKEGKGIFPASVTLTADLHSMGQYIQEGQRMLFETVISVTKSNHHITLESDGDNLDGLDFLAGKRISEVNRMAEIGVALAHTDGGVPNIRIELPEITPYYIGGLLYFFEIACGISGYMLGVNPFDQPGVEAYKKNMFALLEKPGYEKETEEIKKRL